jgi:hypothetical protein
MREALNAITLNIMPKSSILITYIFCVLRQALLLDRRSRQGFQTLKLIELTLKIRQTADGRRQTAEGIRIFILSSHLTLEVRNRVRMQIISFGKLNLSFRNPVSQRNRVSPASLFATSILIGLVEPMMMSVRMRSKIPN